MFLHITVCLLIATGVAEGVRFYNNRRHKVHQNCDEQSCQDPYDHTNAHYDYNPYRCTGPHNWHNLAECWDTCDRSDNDLQSPINIESKKARFNPYSNFQYQSCLCTRVPGFIENHGDAPHFDTGTNYSTIINIINVPGREPGDRYTFNEMHLHLGRNDDAGSEHSVDNKFHPMEAHMVFWNQDKYLNALSAKQSEDGLVVIGVFIKAMKPPTPRVVNEDTEEAEEFEQKSGGSGTLEVECVCNDTDIHCIKSGRCACNTDGDCEDGNICRNHKYCSKPKKCDVRYARKLTYLMEKYYPLIRNYPSPNIPITEEISPADALPYAWEYYTYEGSLTTPPCYETVRWIVMRCPIMVSKKAFKVFKKIKDRDGNSLNTHGLQRPIQRGLSGQKSVSVERNFHLDVQSPQIVIKLCPSSL